MGGEQTVGVDGRRIRLTNLDKVLYPATGTTKAEVIDYVTRIAPLLLPVVAGRPVTRRRWPDGVGTAEDPGPSFFAKQIDPATPTWVRRAEIAHSDGPKAYPIVDDVAALVVLTQSAALELHVPQWRFSPEGERRHPDRLVLDLDPGPGVGLAECAEVARLARTLLAGMGLEAFPVTSGSKGIHLYARLDGSETSDAVSGVARELARSLEADHPDLVVSTMAKQQRAGRIFLDWSQNNGAKTTIAPYSLRGRLEPTVAAPRTWAELDDPGLRQLRFDEVLARAESMPDPLAGLDEAGAPLAVYLDKRTVGRTPEPMPQTPTPAPRDMRGCRFVVQEHHASRLHYDLRLERDGVLVSWAVPKGIPETTTKNHLAVQTEDHPLAYLDFAGTIPRGEYGAGTMAIWDTGTYEAEKWRPDEIIATFRGRTGGALDGARFALIRTDGSGEKSTWLLHRMEVGRPHTVPEHAGPEHAGPGRPTASTVSAPAPMLATAASTTTARTEAAGWSDGGWAEVKWDGVRAIGVWDGGRLRLRARSGTDITDRYPELTAAATGLSAPCVVDGEIVALDGRGLPSFSRLQRRMHLTSRPEIAAETTLTPVRLHLFDLLAHDGVDLVDRPLMERRELLESFAAGADEAITVPPRFDDIDDALAFARTFDLEGIVVKHRGSRYRTGRSREWLKVKLVRHQSVVIGGIRPGQQRTAPIGSLLLGIPSDEGLRYVGRVGSGFSERELARLGEILTPLKTEVPPFLDVPAADAADAVWVRPEVVAEVSHGGISPGGILRHAVWRGVRADQRPEEVSPEP